MEERFTKFFDSPVFGVVGASADRTKYGNKVLRCYQQNGKKAIPINPKGGVIEGVESVSRVADLPTDVKSLSIITPPAVTEKVVEEALAHGIQNVWMQPGAQSENAVARCRDAGINVISDGSCLLVVLGWRGG